MWPGGAKAAGEGGGRVAPCPRWRAVGVAVINVCGLIPVEASSMVCLPCDGRVPCGQNVESALEDHATDCAQSFVCWMGRVEDSRLLGRGSCDISNMIRGEGSSPDEVRSEEGGGVEEGAVGTCT